MSESESKSNPSERRLRLSARLGSRAHLLGLRTTRLEAREGSGAFGDQEYDVSIEVSPGFNVDESLLVYSFDFTVKLTNGRRNALKVRVAYEVAFWIPDDVNYRDEEFQAFGEATAVRVVHPYLRRQIHELTVDFALPATVIDLLRVQLSDPIANALDPSKD